MEININRNVVFVPDEEIQLKKKIKKNDDDEEDKEEPLTVADLLSHQNRILMGFKDLSTNLLAKMRNTDEYVADFVRE